MFYAQKIPRKIDKKIKYIQAEKSKDWRTALSKIAELSNKIEERSKISSITEDEGTELLVLFAKAVGLHLQCQKFLGTDPNK